MAADGLPDASRADPGGISMFEWTTGLRFVVALGLGFLVGLEREGIRFERNRLFFGGVRTFPILSLYGFACAWLHTLGISLAIPVGLLSVAVLASIAYIEKIKTGWLGVTSEVSALLTFVVGALALLSDVRVAMALGVVNTLLLSEKATLEHYVERLDRVEFLAIVKFLLVTMIIYPALPDRAFTAYDLNPARIWRIVIMVSAVGFVGYYLIKRLGSRVGLWASGFLGGIVSSTAVSIAAGRIARETPARAATALQASLVASSVMYLRILVLIAIISPAVALVLGWRLVALAAVGFGLAAWQARRETTPFSADVTSLQNPFEIKTALLFAALFVALTVLTGLARDRFGHAGLLALAGVVGVVDVDPFILSLVQPPHDPSTLMVRAIVIAVMSNTIAKGIYFGGLARSVRAPAARCYGAWALLHIPLLVL